MAVRAPKHLAERVRRLLLDEGLLDNSRSIIRENEMVLLPIKDGGPVLPDGCSIVEAELPPNPRYGKQGGVGCSFDIIGSIAVINKPMDRAIASRIAAEIMANHPRVKTVLLKTGPVSGVERVGRYDVIAGIPSTETVHRESGCIFKLDLSRVFFNPRLGSERLRLAGMTGPGELVVDMFAGVGPFSIVIAKTNKSVRVYSVEMNTHAFYYLVENIRLNRVADRVTAVLGDSSKILRDLGIRADRIIMNLPHQSINYLPTAASIIKPGGVIHLYTIHSGGEPVEKVELAGKILAQAGHHLSHASFRFVKDVSPQESIIRLDLMV
jgi:tRNA (guanine37-N1)-methyltransferase